MNSAIYDLFLHTRQSITPRDLRDFTYADPGYHEYLREWLLVYETKEVPADIDAEPISMAFYENISSPKFEQLERFLNYRRFITSSVLMLIEQGAFDDDKTRASQLTAAIVSDAGSADREYLKLLRPAINSAREVLKAENTEVTYPYFTFASIFLAQMTSDWKAADAAASQLIQDDKDVRENDDLNWKVCNAQLLFGLDQGNGPHWKKLTKQLCGSIENPDTQFIIDAVRVPKKR
ncbi:hypothetical protein JIN82_06590 [Persicirhabdus sediminis]|uniref:Uncharacterized protein n=2 Tax=Persicirhabdus sediminis TaxID=454144 RepID=A0A8J7MDU0_9BACT|nr:hypothetical protein [Persicirhabdus sediminis]